jgi:hypothetical protein
MLRELLSVIHSQGEEYVKPVVAGRGNEFCNVELQSRTAAKVFREDIEVTNEIRDW